MTIRVFLADDHTIVREGLRAYLDAQPDIEIVGEAGNGREAVEQIVNTLPDVAIIDIAMPETNGIKATEMIGKLCPQTEVLILSMHSSNEYVFRALQAGARGYVLKDSAGQELIQAVHTVLEGHRYLSRKVSDQVIADYVKRREEAEAATPLDALSERERQILHLLVEGATSREISASLSLANSTVNTYRSRLMRKLNVDDVASLIRFALENGLFEME
ncbi:MAG: response regulator transcription factor [Anaerolineae bacterium]|jgi:DNA-binding NarL/FixJ family response regulator